MSDQQQPVDGFPNDMPLQPKNTPINNHSNGSFGPVSIILAVILVISLLSCVIGRICNKRRHGDHHHPPKQNHDIEFGIDKRIPNSKVAASNGDHSNIPTNSMPFENEHHGKGGVKFAQDH